MLSQEAIERILGIREVTHLEPKQMAVRLSVTFVPVSPNSLPHLIRFQEQLQTTLKEVGVNIVPFELSMEKLPLRKTVKRFVKIIASNLFFGIRYIFRLPQTSHFVHFSSFPFLLRRRRFKKGLSIIVTGEQKIGSLPMEFIRSFKDNSVVSILDWPPDIHEESSFHEHFDTAMSLFAYHMSNLVLAVGKEKWLLYNFNASHPVFEITKDFRENILHALIPKLYAPISPHTFKDFAISKQGFDPNDSYHKPFVDDLVSGAQLFGNTHLYPVGKKIDDLPFRNEFYRWIGKLHLDNRNGMSYGFIARQLPGSLPKLIPMSIARKHFPKIDESKDFFEQNGEIYIILLISGTHYVLKTPHVSVLTQRSGSDKVQVDPERDILKMGIRDGTLYLEMPRGVKISNDYKPSFDTKVILAHAIGNAIIASILSELKPKSAFFTTFRHSGIALAHWHGYVHPSYVPKGFHLHGMKNPHVACSSPQSAIYALSGKLDAFAKSLEENDNFLGDIHVEPHHGTNINFPTVTELAKKIIESPELSTLGNKYLYLYNKSTHGD